VAFFNARAPAALSALFASSRIATMLESLSALGVAAGAPPLAPGAPVSAGLSPLAAAPWSRATFLLLVWHAATAINRINPVDSIARPDWWLVMRRIPRRLLASEVYILLRDVDVTGITHL
jgi:hypothetical protein